MVINGLTSGWQPVISRVPQRSILGLILFNISISYLGDETERTLSRFGDSTKLEGMIDTANGRAPIQRDLEKLQDGANKLHRVQPDLQNYACGSTACLESVQAGN